MVGQETLQAQRGRSRSNSGADSGHGVDGCATPAPTEAPGTPLVMNADFEVNFDSTPAVAALAGRGKVIDWDRGRGSRLGSGSELVLAPLTSGISGCGSDR